MIFKGAPSVFNIFISFKLESESDKSFFTILFGFLDEKLMIIFT